MEINDYVQTPISSMKARFSEVRHNSTLLIKAALTTVDEVLEGKASLMDASSPAVMLMEMAAVQSANSVQESISLIRRQYPALAETSEELYLHMSDEDYLNRFATPSNSVTMRFAIQYNDFLREAVYDSSELAQKIVIPRDSTIEVDGTVFSVLYPVILRRYDNGVFQATYGAENSSPIMALKNTIIDYTVVQGSELEQWIIFDLTVLQVADTTAYFTIDKTYNFKKTISYVDNYYYTRVFFKNNNTNNLWVEMKTTHTDQVFDVSVPTALLSVDESANEVSVSIPVIYTTKGLVIGEIRVDVYSTKGALSMDLRNYRPDVFKVNLKAIDDIRDLNVYTEAMTNISYYVFSKEVINSGKAAIAFEELRERVIFNSVGPQVLPITSIQVETEGVNQGFEIVRHVDTITNRIFLAAKKLPAPSAKSLITPANIGIITYTTNTSELIDHYKGLVNQERTTIRSKAIWKSVNGVVSLITKPEFDALHALPLTALVEKLNAEKYYYTPFYYVLDASGEEFELRPYALDRPYAKDQNFIRQNQSLQLLVNTSSYELKKTEAGYDLYILTKSGNNYRSLQDSEVAVQLAFNPYGENTYAYINGVLDSKTAANDRIYKFEIRTNHDLDSDDLLCITNASVSGITDYKAWVSLETVFNLIHSTNRPTVAFKSDKTDDLVGKFLLPVGFVGNTHEQLTLHFGDSLKYLWRRSRSYQDNVIYKKHTVNIPLTWEEDVFEKDVDTGAIFNVVSGALVYNYEHRAGDPVLDDQGNVVYKYQVGDVMLDEEGMSIVELASRTGREIDLFVADAKYYFATDRATSDYCNEIEDTVTSWITNDITEFNAKLLDQSKIFFYPKTTVGSIQVVTENSGSDTIDAEQSFIFTLYVKENIFSDEVMRERLKVRTIKILDAYIAKTTINMTELRSLLKSAYAEAVSAFSVTGLGGTKDYQYLTVVNGGHSVCLKKRINIQADRTTNVEASVNINFSKIN